MKHGVAAGALAPSPDWTIPQRWADYTAQEHATWHTLFTRQTRLLEGRACAAFRAGLARLPMTAERIPDFAALNAELKPRTGWQVVAVPGLIPDGVFFDHLANRRFPAGSFIRKADQIDYLEEPDVFHDVFGHVPMLMDPVTADFIAAYGEGGLRAQRLDVLKHLARVYWYTIEFGLVREDESFRIYGAGIASSATESVFALESDSPNRIAFDLERVMRTDYRIDDFQETYFVLDSLDDLLALARIDFAPVYERVRGAAALTPGDISADDKVFARGTGAHHHRRD
ncbi:MAG: phenylalanine 4-monooxygenase [Burkholderiales bacterium]|nr:phenylalanine 4-monooxygenase [Burkholderiales bacterium]